MSRTTMTLRSSIVLLFVIATFACTGSTQSPTTPTPPPPQNTPPPAPTPSTATLKFAIDQQTCGTVASAPIVDVFVDDRNVGTIYNMTSPGSATSVAVTVGSHMVKAEGGRGAGGSASYGPTMVEVPATGLTISIPCR